MCLTFEGKKAYNKGVRQPHLNANGHAVNMTSLLTISAMEVAKMAKDIVSHPDSESQENNPRYPVKDLVFPMTIIAAWKADNGKVRVQDQGGGALPLDYASALKLRNALNEYLSYGEEYITTWRAAFLEMTENTKSEYVTPPKAPEKGYVYLMKRDGMHKIGITKNIKSRISQMKTSSVTPIELVCQKLCDDMLGVETALHIQFSDKRVRGEWFDLTPEDVEIIKGALQ